MFTNERVEMEICDVRTHYNETKGDIMFTFFKKKPATKAKQPIKTKYTYVSTATQTFSEIGEVKRLPIDTRNSNPTITTYGSVTAEYDSASGELVMTSTGNGNGLVKVDDQEIETNFVSEAEKYNKEQEAIEQEIEESSKPLTLKIEGLAACRMPVGSVDTRTVSISNKNISLNQLTVMTSDNGYISVSKVNGKLKIKALKETSQVSVWVKYGNTTSSKVHIEVTEAQPFVIDEKQPITVIKGNRSGISGSNVDEITWDPNFTGSQYVDTIVQHSNLSITFRGVEVGTAKFKIRGYVDGAEVADSPKTVTVNVVDDVPLEKLYWEDFHSIQPGATIRVVFNKNENGGWDDKQYLFLPKPLNYNSKLYEKTMGPAIVDGSFVGDHSIVSIYCSMVSGQFWMKDWDGNSVPAGRLLFKPNKAGHCLYALDFWKGKTKHFSYYFDVTVNE